MEVITMTREEKRAVDRELYALCDVSDITMYMRDELQCIAMECDKPETYKLIAYEYLCACSKGK